MNGRIGLASHHDCLEAAIAPRPMSARKTVDRIIAIHTR